MALGTIATGTIFASVIGLKAYEQVTVRYPTQILLAMAAGMSIPVVAWMLVRGMGRTIAAEMAAAIVLPVLPFLSLVGRHRQRRVLGLSRDGGRGGAGADGLPPQHVLDGEVDRRVAGCDCWTSPCCGARLLACGRRRPGTPGPGGRCSCTATWRDRLRSGQQG
jgi:hypothetical protein